MTPSEVIIANETFIEARVGKASADVLDANMGKDFDAVKLKYLFLAQMLASTTTRQQRAKMAMDFVQMMAMQQGGLTEEDVKRILDEGGAS
jgi:hypothetical protein